MGPTRGAADQPLEAGTTNDAPSGGLTRRSVLKAAASGAMLATGGSMLAACGGSASSTSSTEVAGQIKRGGVLRVGVAGGGSTDTVDALNWISNADGARVFQLYNSLVEFDSNAQPRLSLAEELTPNSTGTEWTLRLRKGITFHNGKDLTVDDVIHTFRLITNPKSPQTAATLLQPVDVANLRKLDSHTLQIPCHTPYAGLVDALPCYQIFIVPVGYNPKQPVGTGPFKYQSFTPGQQSTFVRNENYWKAGLPYVDTITITDFSDETSQVNALLSHQTDIVDQLSGGSVAVLQSGGAKVLVSEGGGFTPFTMRVNQAPFNDVRVRQAFRLIVDRPQMLRQVFGNYGIIGNDLFGYFDPTYDHSLPQRTADIEHARSLLKQAGHESLTVNLVSSDLAAGALKAATVFAQQASAAGVTVNIQQVPVSTLFGPNYKHWTFAQDVWLYYPYQPDAQEALLPGGVFNECNVNDPTFNKLFAKLTATTDAAKRKDLVHEMQTREWNAQSSGYIIPYFIPELDGYAANVHGLTPNKTGNPMSNYGFEHVWLA